MPSHHRKSNYTEDGEGTLNNNFLVYENNKDTLKKMLLAEQKNINPEQVYDNFRNDYPEYNTINAAVLNDFLTQIDNKSIHSKTHLLHQVLN